MVSADEKTPRLKAPAGACDTHMHFYNAQIPFSSDSADDATRFLG